MDTQDYRLIAPCGMNCSICRAYLRKKNGCLGCRSMEDQKAKSILNCKIRTCEHLLSSGFQFCYECDQYPCQRVKHMDHRYKTKYDMSVVENLESIRLEGITTFIEKDRKKWTCPHCGGVICVHSKVCADCGKMPKVDP